MIAGSVVLKSLHRGWKSVEEVGYHTRENMRSDAKKDAHARYLVRYGSIHGKQLEDDLRKFLLKKSWLYGPRL